MAKCEHKFKQYRIGKHMELRRTQTEDYDFRRYVEELEKGEVADPEEVNDQDAQLAVQNMTKRSDALQKVKFNLKHMYEHIIYCPTVKPI